MPSCCNSRTLPKLHRATIKRPPSGTFGSRGQVTGSETTVKADVPIGLEELSGREFEFARQRVANATHRVQATLEPDWAVTTKDYLEVTKLSGVTLTLNIGAVINIDGLDREHELTCMEAA